MPEAKANLLYGVEYIGKPEVIANNTVRYTRPDGAIVIRLFRTNIITQHLNGSIELNSGGWRTKTTRARIRDFANVYLLQKRGKWYLPDGSEFYDGVILP